jgi:hypothetical protein
VVITARGQAPVAGGATIDLAIASLTVGGRVELADILAGYDVGLTPVDGDAAIGPVRVGHDWIASNLVAGGMNPPSGNRAFGNGDDESIGPGQPALLSTLVGIDIRGRVVGRDDGGSDHFGFVAQHIVSVKAGGLALRLTANQDLIELSPGTGDVTVLELETPG